MAESGEVTREETVDGIKFVYHRHLDPLGWVDKKRVIHLADPEYLVAFIRNHELVHHHRWNKPSIRCYRLPHTPVGCVVLFTFLSLSLALALLGFTPIPTILAMGIFLFFLLSSSHEEKIAMEEAEKMTCADKIKEGKTIGNGVSNDG